MIADAAAGADLATPTWTTAPPHVRARLRGLAADLAAVCVAGRRTPVARLAADHAEATSPGTEATALFDGRPLGVAGAAFANGVLANALDFDDGHRLAKGHPGGCVLPAALAMAEREGATVAQAFDAALLGYEVALAVAEAQHASLPAYHASGSWGASGAAAAAARLLALPAEGVLAAAAVAAYHAPIAPIMGSVATPSMAKDAVGWGASTGVHAALLVAAGWTTFAPPHVAALPARLRERWRTAECYVKPYPSCRWSQPAVRAAIALRAEHGPDPDDVAAIRVRTFAAAGGLARERPTTTEEAQYSLVWPVATALVHGRFDVEDALAPFDDPEVARLAERIAVIVDPDLDARFPEERWARVEVELAGGRLLASPPTQAAGEPEDSAWEAIVADKVAALVPGAPTPLAPGTPVAGRPLETLLSGPAEGGGDAAA